MRGSAVLQSGQAGAAMHNRFNQVGTQRALAMYADWTDRIAAWRVSDGRAASPAGP